MCVCMFRLPSVLCHSWLCDRKGIRLVKNLAPAVFKGCSLADRWGLGINLWKMGSLKYISSSCQCIVMNALIFYIAVIRLIFFAPVTGHGFGYS